MKIVSSLFATLLALPLAACVITDNDDDTDTNATGGTDVTDATATMTTSASTSATMSTTDTADSSGTDPTDTDPTDTDPTSGSMTCQHTCAADGDCTIGGMDVGLICQDSACTLANPCAAAEDCVAQFSGWAFLPCTMGGGECAAAMQVCIDLGDGTGGCATPPSEFVTCDLLMQTESEQTNLDDGMPVTVCANTAGECNTDNGYCYLPCVDDTTCGTQVCNTETSQCECDSDDDCGEGTCDAGACTAAGCADDTECTNAFDGGTVACG